MKFPATPKFNVTHAFGVLILETPSESESQLTTDSSSGRPEDSASEPRSPPELERQVDVRGRRASASASSAVDAEFKHKAITQWNVSTAILSTMFFLES